MSKRHLRTQMKHNAEQSLIAWFRERAIELYEEDSVYWAQAPRFMDQMLDEWKLDVDYENWEKENDK